MTRDTSLGGGREFDLVRRMQERWGTLAVGLGDDAAVIDVPRGDRLVASTDAAVEGVHFRRDWLPLDAIAYRAATAALSDLAAMAAQPLGLLVALELPSTDEALVDALADGIGAAARAAGTVIRGGNIASSQALAITTTVLGAAHAPLARSGARPGDVVYVTGVLGGPAAAVRALRAGSRPADAWMERFARPVARVAEARWLAARGATAMIDISDGLGGDASHLAAASGCVVEIDLDRVPLLTGAEPGDVGGGEEYELLVAAPSGLDMAAFERACGTRLTAVGRAVRGGAEARFTRSGARVATPRGHDHLSR